MIPRLGEIRARAGIECAVCGKECARIEVINHELGGDAEVRIECHGQTASATIAHRNLVLDEWWMGRAFVQDQRRGKSLRRKAEWT